MINISINVELGKIIIKDSFDLGLFFKKEYPIEPTGRDPLHKRNIEEIRFKYNEIQDLFKISVSPTSKYYIHLKAKIYKCEHLDLFLDIYCIDQEKYRDKILDFSKRGNNKAIESYLRSLLGDDIIDEYLQNIKKNNI